MHCSAGSPDRNTGFGVFRYQDHFFIRIFFLNTLYFVGILSRDFSINYNNIVDKTDILEIIFQY